MRPADLWRSVHLRRTFWALTDQVLVSLGVFLGQILMAQHLPRGEYGTFALLFSGALTLQLINTSLLFYPMSVRLVVTLRGERDALLADSLVLIGLLSIALGVVLVLALLAFGVSALAGAALSWFLLWQTQEALRRGLLAEIKPHAVIAGDALTYLGQAATIAGLAYMGRLSVASALHAMAGMSLLGALVHGWWLRPNFGARPTLRRTFAEYVAIGGFQALGNGMLATLRIQLLPWALAIGSGPAATAALQAAVNVMNASNPVIIGLANIVPQAASQSSAEGLDRAWHTVLRYALLGMPLILAYSLLLLAFPGFVLRLLYGAASGYADLSVAVRLLVFANLVGIAAEFVVWFLHGVRAVRRAIEINLAGALATLALTFPLVAVDGLTGGCLAMIGANGARLIFAHRMLTGMTGTSRQ